MTTYVLDTYALLAWLANEPAAGSVERLLRETAAGATKLYASWINVCEVYYVTLRSATAANKKVLAGKALEIIKSLPLELVPAGEAECIAAGSLKSRFSISLADAFAAGLAWTYEATLATADPEFKTLEEEGILRVLWLPEKNRGKHNPPRRRNPHGKNE